MLLILLPPDAVDNQNRLFDDSLDQMSVELGTMMHCDDNEPLQLAEILADRQVIHTKRSVM